MGIVPIQEEVSEAIIALNHNHSLPTNKSLIESQLTDRGAELQKHNNILQSDTISYGFQVSTNDRMQQQQQQQPKRVSSQLTNITP